MLLDEIRAIKSERRDLRNFGLVVGGVIAGIGAWMFWKDRPAYPYFAGAGTLLMALGLLLPAVLRPLQRAWMALAVVLGWIMSRVILSVMFFAVITPIGVAARLLGRRFLDLRFRDSKAGSYWIGRPSEGPKPKESHEKQF